jgi:hypothetical protein
MSTKVSDRRTSSGLPLRAFFLYALACVAIGCADEESASSALIDTGSDSAIDVDGDDAADSVDASNPPEFELPESREGGSCGDVDWSGGTCSGTVGPGSCETDSDCEGSALCRPEIVELRDSVCTCRASGCSQDADCATNEACACGDYDPVRDRWCGGASDVRCVGQCLPAECRSASDCDPGEICAAYSDTCGRLQGWACRAEVEWGCVSHPACSIDLASLPDRHVRVCTYCATSTDCGQYAPGDPAGWSEGWRCDVRPEIPICD